MSEESDTPAAPEAAEAAQAAKASRLPKAIVAACMGLMAILAALILTMRFGVLLPQARQFIEARTDGLKLGSFGRLKIEGLTGDVWRDFRIRRLTVRDDQGVWLDAKNVHMRWRYGELLIRRFHASEIEVQNLQLIRRPHRTPSTGPEEPMPVAVNIDAAHGQVEMLPAFSVQRGVYDLSLFLNLRRSGGMRGTVRAASVLRAGDHLNLQFDLRKRRPLLVLADVVEARGGAIAGAAGLPANQPFLLRVQAGGRTSAGRFTALAISGATRPLEASGAWSPDGGQASGRAMLTASSLTAGFAERLGPEVRFNVSGRKADKGFYDLALQASAANLSLQAQGRGDLGARKLAPKGVSLAASSPALSKITGGPQMGAARLTGMLTQTGAKWRFAGPATVSQLAMAGYGLDQVSGPLELSYDPNEIGVKVQLAARGGRGAGWVAALMGTAPRANLEGGRLKDGRILLRKLEVAGSGLRVQASGGRGFLGGLTFKGQADVTNLSAAHAGASGTTRIDWSAAQARAREPWNLKLDAMGDKLATGYPELDRLLGQKPQLSAQGALQGRRLSLTKASLKGAAINAASAGVMNEDGKLAFKLDWSAQGPFRAGPVEIAGAARGNGALSGTLAAPRADLIADFAEIDVPNLPLKAAHVTLSFLRQADGSSGMISATAASAYGPARARADFRFPEGGVDLSDLSVDAGGIKADGSVGLRRTGPSAANLTLAVSKGAFLEAGHVAAVVRISDSAGGSRVQLNLTAQDARTPGSTTTLTSAKLVADGPLARLPYTLAAKGVASAGPFLANGRGVFSQLQPGYAATFDGAGRLGGRDLSTTETATFRFSDAERSARLRLASSDGGRISVDGRLTKAMADIHAQMTGVGLNLVDEDLAGKVDATLAVQGQGGHLEGGLDARLSGARGRGAPLASGVDSVVRGRLAGSSLTIDATATNGQGLKANASVVLPTETSAAPFRVAIARQQPMSGKFFASGEVRPLWDLLIGGERSLGGQVETQGTIGGTLADPQASGQISVAGGRFDDGATGLSLRNMTIQANFARTGVDVTQATGEDGQGGSVSGSGKISLERQGVSSFRLNLHGFRLIDNEQGVASASGQATINRGADGKVKLSGALTIDKATIAPRLPGGTSVVTMDVVEKNRPPELVAAERATTTAAAADGTGGWALDVSLRAPGRVFLRGKGLNVELSLDAHVGGTTAAPTLSGTARVVRGDYDFAGKRFEFDDESVVYLSTKPRDIRLNLAATRDDPTLTAVVKITGTAAKPELTFTSTPSLPSDEVLSQVLFGTSASQLSPLEAAQLAAAVSALASGGGLDVIGNLRAFAGLDRLSLGGGDSASGGVTVSGGKYITEKIYLEVSGGGREGPSAQVEWRVKRQLSILSRFGGQNGAKLAIRWRRDY
ncbi:MAG TPA: translocation/assembly module TamB domain-containing protein [Phenylobacterium sp.]|uniref:translocation/assembly module TamB domain-containing protein n=1 Tax=Phenylobacterium sp. TaxID=1871053 RepID=UPI002B473957|nr:translocation/assembly module TamB domain-containing protein [Phenylobacterium sp.]HKR87352.1 translocation/assembly module TamB domain-containing protein [Phenylobacterium sp.]